MAQKTKREHRRRRKRQRRQNGARLGMLVVVTAVVFTILAGALFFRAETVEVSGNVLYSDAQVMEALGIKPGVNMFFAGRGGTVQTVSSVLPYIASAQVQRQFPATIRITVQESAPLAYIEMGTQFWLVDGSCRLLESVSRSQAQGRYIRVLGLEPAEPQAGQPLPESAGMRNAVAYLKALFAQLGEKDMLSHVGWIDVTQASSIRFSYLGRFTVRLGAGTQLQDKLELVTAVAADMAPDARGVLDASDGQTVRFIAE